MVQKEGNDGKYEQSKQRIMGEAGSQHYNLGVCGS